MENYQPYIQPELIGIIPVLFLIGTQLKRSKRFPDSKIPLTLGLIGIALSILYVFSTVPLSTPKEVMRALFTALTQGAMCAATSVFTHQLIKQGRNGDNPGDSPSGADSTDLNAVQKPPQSNISPKDPPA